MKKSDDNLAVNCIDRQATLDAIIKRLGIKNETYLLEAERVIYQQILAMPSVTPQEPRWIPLTKRPMTDEEREHYFEYTDMRIDDTYTILDCPLPDDGQEVLVSWGGNVGNDVFIQDNKGCYFEGMDIDEVDAWMPLPKPYSEVEV